MKPQDTTLYRLNLTISQKAKLDGWRDQLQEPLFGNPPHRADLISWMLDRAPDQLGIKEIKEVQERHFSLAESLAWVTQTVRERKLSNDDARRLLERAVQAARASGTREGPSELGSLNDA